MQGSQVVDNRHKACRRACLGKVAFGRPAQGREGIVLARTRRGEWTFGRAECLALPFRIRAAPRCGEGLPLPLVPPLVPSAAYVVRFLGS